MRADNLGQPRAVEAEFIAALNHHDAPFWIVPSHGRQIGLRIAEVKNR
jgi:hypothetical protein